MKTKLLTIAVFGLLFSAVQAQSFQKKIQHDTGIYHDLNTDIIEDGSGDYIIAGNLFEQNMISSVISLKRMNQSGNVVWAKEYTGSGLQNARLFDIGNMYDMIILTGSIDVGGIKQTFIAKIEAATGNVLSEKHFDIGAAGLNSTGLNILHTNSDANNNGTLDRGFVVAGFSSDCYGLDTTCTNNYGFVLRVDQNLNVLWTSQLDTQLSGNNDYDFVNKIIETTDGFFLTGSATGVTSNGFERQGNLAYFIDFEGNTVWDSSYYSGNSNDVSVDAYQEPTTGNIYMLSNSSSMSNFGITVFDINGAIIPNLSWVIDSGDLHRYGFSLKESVDSYNNLVVFGYSREELWTGSGGFDYESQSNLFIYEFEKATGNGVSLNYQYLTPHIEAPGDEYNFWDWQMPIIYYPDIATTLTGNSGTPESYLSVGYNTPLGTSATMAEITKTIDKSNICENIQLVLPHSPININPISIDLNLITSTGTSMVLLDDAYNFTLWNCDGSLGIEDHSDNGTGGIFPNPTNGELTIYLEKNTITSFTIYSVLGQKVMEAKPNEKMTTLDVSGLNTGVYYISITDDSNNNHTHRLIKK